MLQEDGKLLDGDIDDPQILLMLMRNETFFLDESRVYYHRQLNTSAWLKEREVVARQNRSHKPMKTSMILQIRSSESGLMRM